LWLLIFDLSILVKSIDAEIICAICFWFFSSYLFSILKKEVCREKSMLTNKHHSKLHLATDILVLNLFCKVVTIHLSAMPLLTS
jgi:hypothetical protein